MPEKKPLKLSDEQQRIADRAVLGVLRELYPGLSWRVLRPGDPRYEEVRAKCDEEARAKRDETSPLSEPEHD